MITLLNVKYMFLMNNPTVHTSMNNRDKKGLGRTWSSSLMFITLFFVLLDP